jgi:hypothetical protein
MKLRREMGTWSPALVLLPSPPVCGGVKSGSYGIDGSQRTPK